MFTTHHHGDVISTSIHHIHKIVPYFVLPIGKGVIEIFIVGDMVLEPDC